MNNPLINFIPLFILRTHCVLLQEV